MKKRNILIILTIVTILITGVFSFYKIKTDKLKKQKKKNTEYKKKHEILEEITKEPHVAGSSANYKVRDYLIKEIEALGLKAEVTPFTISVAKRTQEIEAKMVADSEYAASMSAFMKAKGYDTPQEYVSGKLGNPETDEVTLHNILVKLDNPATDEGVMLVSHYDSVSTGPGAADDGIAVASMMSFLHTAVQENDFKNDLYFLFTDGEEQGLLGAYDFVEKEPQYKEKLKTVFNFEARGNQGALIMFESSSNNYDLVKHLNKAVPQPVTFSLATAVYEKMPNNTDFSVFKSDGYHGLNFAMVEGVENYHEMSDNFENLDKNTAYQYYQTVFGIGEYFGNLDLAKINNNQEGLFFPFLGLTIIVIPQLLGYILGILPLLLALVILIKDKKDGKLKIQTVIGYTIGGIVPLALVILAYPTSYMFTIPMTLLFLLDIIIRFVKDKYLLELLGSILFLLTTFMITLLFVPLIFMIQVAIQSWIVTLICFLIPLILIGLYLWKSLQIFSKN